jgi:hypothetical protein
MPCPVLLHICVMILLHICLMIGVHRAGSNVLRQGLECKQQYYDHHRHVCLRNLFAGVLDLLSTSESE